MTHPKTAIILCTYNGGQYLDEQLASYAAQTTSDWDLFVYDDGSTDKTETLVQTFQQQVLPRAVHWQRNATKRGFALNFLYGLVNTPDHYDYYAFSDQDDVWAKNKLARAQQFFSNVPENIPAVYGTRTTLTDAQGNVIGLSRLFNKRPSFKNALMQSIAGGNTMVLNRAARDLIHRADKNINVESHDWFIYQLVTGAGGIMHYDVMPTLLYRQHGGNLIGSNLGFFARFSRMLNLFNGTFQGWMDRNLDALSKNTHLLTAENQAFLQSFIAARHGPVYQRPVSFVTLGFYRQQRIDNMALFCAWCLGCI